MKADLMREAERLAQAPYTIKVTQDNTTSGKPVFVARVLELGGCVSQGRTSEEALDNARAALVDYIYSLLEDGLPVPRPSSHVTSTTSQAATFPLEHPVHERGQDDPDAFGPSDMIQVVWIPTTPVRSAAAPTARS